MPVGWPRLQGRLGTALYGRNRPDLINRYNRLSAPGAPLCPDRCKDDKIALTCKRCIAKMRPGQNNIGINRGIARSIKARLNDLNIRGVDGKAASTRERSALGMDLQEPGS